MNIVKISLIIHNISEDVISLSVKSRINQNTSTEEITVANPFMQQTLEKMRWYFEDSFAKPVHISSIENEITSKGKILFDSIFKQYDTATANIRKYAGEQLENIEIEIIENRETHFYPWELLIDSKTNLPLVITAKKFLRNFKESNNNCTIYRGLIRVLLIIARPNSMADVHLRTIALSLKKLIAQHDKFEFTVLRPPTFDHLIQVLEASNANKKPFHLIHFDGHGVHGSEIAGLDPGKGYLVFENEDASSPVYIDGLTLGNILRVC